MNNLLVFQSDFGLVDGAVSAMEGVSYGVSEKLNIRHLTHEIPQFNIFEASYRLFQAINYWPKGTVFVSIVDPGVGSDRKSVVGKTKNGYYIVTPDNGTLTHVGKFLGFEEIREIDESINRLKNSEQSYTFHGRDVYAYTGARLSSGVITFEEVGPVVNNYVELPLFGSRKIEKGIEGQIEILDVRFGSLWTSIDIEDFKSCGFSFNDKVLVEIYNNDKKVYSGSMLYGKSFADVSVNEPLVYMCSTNHMAVAINQNSFARVYGISTGTGWTIQITK